MSTRLKGCLAFWVTLVVLLSVFMPNFFPFIRRVVTMATDKYVSGTHSIAYVTCPDKDVATKLAQGLVSNKLAACVNIIPAVQSIYEWKGKIETDNEVLLMIKTRTHSVEHLTRYVKINHPYDVAEVITTKIDNGNPPYLKWISDTVPDKDDDI